MQIVGSGACGADELGSSSFNRSESMHGFLIVALPANQTVGVVNQDHVVLFDHGHEKAFQFIFP